MTADPPVQPPSVERERPGGVPRVPGRVEGSAGHTAAPEQMSALMSSDGVYRYQLHRSWGHTSRPLVWIMLNPSTADHATDDPTIRRVRAFTKRAGFCAFTVVNLFALRSTDPRALTTAADAVGNRNDSYIREALQTAGGIICAWGGSYPKTLAWRVSQVADLLDGQAVRPTALGFTASGDPRHPLYVRGDALFQPWPLIRTGLNAGVVS